MHEHIGPINPTHQPGYSRPAPTPQMNWRVPNQAPVWDNGEAFRPGTLPDADYGGHLGYLDQSTTPWTTEYTPGVEVGDIFHVDQTLNPGVPYGWRLITYTDARRNLTANLWHFVGYLRPGQLGPYVGTTAGTIQDAAFELFYPAELPSDPSPTIVIGAWGTTAKRAPWQGGQNAYPGNQRPDGLVDDTLLLTGIFRATDPAIVIEAAAKGQLVITGYIVPRLFGRAELFEVQRNRELRQAIRLMLAEPLSSPLHPPDIGVFPLTSNDVPCMVTGGSFGGLTAQILCVRYPAEFQGAAISVFGYGPRRVLADQFNLDYFVTKGGFASFGGAYGLGDSLEWGTAFRWMDQAPGSPGWDYFNLSVLLRKKRGELYGPMVWHAPDEDTIAHGTDSLPLITGSSSYVPRYFGPGLAFLAYSAVDRRCHDYGWYTTAIASKPNSWHWLDHTHELVQHVVSAHAANPNPPVPPLLSDDGSEDPFAWVQHRALPPDFVAGPTDPLLLDTSFGPVSSPGRTCGAGLALGRDESLRFAIIDTNDPVEESVFCGSADGVVTRFVRNPTTYAFDVMAESVPLGYGAFALDVGQLDDGLGVKHVVAGTTGHLFVLDASTLSVLRSTAMPRGFEHVRPRRIQIADVFSGPEYPGPEIVLTTLLGHLLVFPGNSFLTMTDLGEPGIQDFAVLEGLTTPSAGTTSATPIILLSHRGTTAHITLNKVNDPKSRNPHPALVHAWTGTVDEMGAPADIEIVDAPTGVGPVAVVLYQGPDHSGSVHYPQIRCFDALTMQPTILGTHGIPPTMGWIGLRTLGVDVISLDLAPIHLAGGSGALAGFVLLMGSRIAFVPISGMQPNGTPPAGYILDGFPPAARALGLITADIATRPGGQTYREEIILSTLGGHVVWMHLEDLLSNSNPQGFMEYIGPAPVPAPPVDITPYTNKTLSGQWGFLPHDVGAGTVLFGANQSGELFATDPVSGVGVRQDLIREPLSQSGTNQFNPGGITAPVRSLALVGATVGGAVNTLEVQPRTTTTPGSTLRWFRTQPWENYLNDVMNPWWVRGDVPWAINLRSPLPVVHGLAALVGSGASIANGTPIQGATRQLHWWGGGLGTYTNLIQGAYLDAAQVLDNWYSSAVVPSSRLLLQGSPILPATAPPDLSWRGRGAADCKDLRNEVRAWAQTHQMQSLRIGMDAFAQAQDGGPLIVASTVGGSLVLMRAGRSAGQSSQDYGRVIWDSADPGVPWDEGMYAMGLALRAVPGDPNQALDIFVGLGITHLDPGPWLNGSGPGTMTGAIAWYRWVASSATSGVMTRLGLLPLTPNANNAIGPRGGFGVCGLGVGDVIDTVPGEELIATTLEGDLFVFGIPGSGMLGPQNILYRTWARGALGASNSIAIFDSSDPDARNELWVAGSMGIWKWKQR